jgi:drug/metabolite transporter (DMT)-like permease
VTAHHHEVPTHLNVEDKIVFGLSVRQFLYMLVGSSVSYSLWEQSAALGDLLRVSLVAISVWTTLAFALLRPADRPLEEWLAALLVFLATPKQAIWRVREPRPPDWRLAGGSWQELAPSLTWVGDDGEQA